MRRSGTPRVPWRHHLELGDWRGDFVAPPTGLSDPSTTAYADCPGRRVRTGTGSEYVQPPSIVFVARRSCVDRPDAVKPRTDGQPTSGQAVLVNFK